MAEQLDHLVEMAQRPSILIEVIPLDVGAHEGVNGAFVIAVQHGVGGQFGATLRIRLARSLCLPQTTGTRSPQRCVAGSSTSADPHGG
jgi:hypothetical protein